MCGTCDFVKGNMALYPGNDLLAMGAPCPDWWESLGVGECKAAPTQVALIFDGKEACCTFCIEHNRRGLQPPCTRASFGPSGGGIQNLCYMFAKSGTPSKLEASKCPRASFLAGEPCATYHPPSSASWGVVFLLALGVVVVAYVTGGLRLGARRHPHSRAWQDFWGFVVDGFHFVARGKLESTGGDGRDASSDKEAQNPRAPLLLPASGASTDAAVPKQATRGVATALHQAVATASVSKVQQLLTSPCASLNAGDKRSSTPFHNACASGHVEIVQLLLAAGCDTGLTNDSGYDGWELATHLHRAEVLALREGRGTGRKRSADRKKTRHGGRSKVAPATAAGAAAGAKAGGGEEEAPRRFIF